MPVSLNPRGSAPHRSRPGVAPTVADPARLLRGIVWGLVFAAPVWLVALAVTIWLIRTHG
jgi:hypothetical protein